MAQQADENFSSKRAVAWELSLQAGHIRNIAQLLMCSSAIGISAFVSMKALLCQILHQAQSNLVAHSSQCSMDAVCCLHTSRDTLPPPPLHAVSSMLDAHAHMYPAGYTEAKPMVFCGMFPSDGDQFEDLREALGKLQLNDSALSFEPEVGAYRCIACRPSADGFEMAVAAALLLLSGGDDDLTKQSDAVHALFCCHHAVHCFMTCVNSSERCQHAAS